MNSGRDLKAPRLSYRFILLMALTAALAVAVLKIVSAPFWTLYFAGVISAPFILYLSRKHDAARSTTVATGSKNVATRETKSAGM